MNQFKKFKLSNKKALNTTGGWCGTVTPPTIPPVLPQPPIKPFTPVWAPVWPVSKS